MFIARSPSAHVDGDAHHVFADERVEMVSFPGRKPAQLALEGVLTRYLMDC